MVFHWRLSESKSPQVSRTFLSIQAVFNNAVVGMVSTRPPTSKSSRPFNNPLVTVPNAPITIGIIVTFMFHRFFQFSSKIKILISLFSLFFLFLLSLLLLLLLLHLESYLHQLTLMVFHWSLSDNKFLQVSRTLLSILADVKNVIAWIVSTHPLIPTSPSPCANPLTTYQECQLKLE